MTHVWKFAVMAGIEYAFNKYPSTELSSAVLVASLLIVEIFAVFISQDPPASSKERYIAEDSASASVGRTSSANSKAAAATRTSSKGNNKKKQ